MLQKLNGYKTYVAAGLAAVVAFLAALGKIDGSQSETVIAALESLWQVLAALALVFLRAGAKVEGGDK